MIKKYQIFKETINNVIQNSNLDIGAVYFILKDIFLNVERLYYSQINRECLEEAKNINSETDKNNIKNENIKKGAVGK